MTEISLRMYSCTNESSTLEIVFDFGHLLSIDDRNFDTMWVYENETLQGQK